MKDSQDIVALVKVKTADGVEVPENLVLAVQSESSPDMNGRHR